MEININHQEKHKFQKKIILLIKKTGQTIWIGHPHIINIGIEIIDAVYCNSYIYN